MSRRYLKIFEIFTDSQSETKSLISFIQKLFTLLCANRIQMASLTLTAGTSECERGVYFILDLNEGIQNHRPTAVIMRTRQ